MANIKKGTVTLDDHPYALMTHETMDGGRGERWITDTNISGKATITPYRAKRFAAGVTVQIVIDGRHYFRTLSPIKQEQPHELTRCHQRS